MQFRKGNIVRINNVKVPYANETGEITGFISQGKDRPQLIAVRLDHGYQAPNSAYKDIRYTCIVEEAIVSRCPDDVPRSFSKRICSFCGNPCYSNLLTKIAFEVNDAVVCENCQSEVFLDSKSGTFKSVKADLEKKRANKAGREKPKKE